MNDEKKDLLNLKTTVVVWPLLWRTVLGVLCTALVACNLGVNVATFINTRDIQDFGLTEVCSLAEMDFGPASSNDPTRLPSWAILVFDGSNIRANKRYDGLSGSRCARAHHGSLVAQGRTTIGEGRRLQNTPSPPLHHYPSTAPSPPSEQTCSYDRSWESYGPCKNPTILSNGTLVHYRCRCPTGTCTFSTGNTWYAKTYCSS